MIKHKDHHFNTSHAKKYGIIEAILIHNLMFWIEENYANKRNIHTIVEGDFIGQKRCWSYNSVSAYSKIFDYISPKKIRMALDALVEKKILLKGHFSPNKVDRTNWYSFYCEEEFIDEKYLSKISHLPHRANPFAQQGESIYTDTIQTNNKNTFPAEEKVEVISLLTSNDTMYEVSNPNIVANCTFPSSDVIIPTEPISAEKPKKKSAYEANPNMYDFINRKFKEWNENSPSNIQIKKPNFRGTTQEEKRGTTYVLKNIYEKWGEEKATAFFDFILSKDYKNRNVFSLVTLKNQEEFENFYQDPEKEQPRYLTHKDYIYMAKTYGNKEKCPDEPSITGFPKEEPLYAAFEHYYSQTLSGTELVKKVRERLIELNAKYKKY